MLRVELETFKVAILTGVEAEPDKRRIGSQSHFDKEEILERMITLHNELLKKEMFTAGIQQMPFKMLALLA